MGKAIKQNLQMLPIVIFEAIPFADFPTLPMDVLNDLSWDQSYLYRICHAIIIGIVDADLAAIEPGPPCVSRWNILWSRICRLYVATRNPSMQLKRLTTIIVKFSAPMWFHIKRRPYAYQGAVNVHTNLQLLKHLTRKEQELAKTVIQRNAFFAHPDQILLAMCVDEQRAVRSKAVRHIQRIRSETRMIDESLQNVAAEVVGSSSTTDEPAPRYTSIETHGVRAVNEMIKNSAIRRMKIPKLRWNAKAYHTMIDMTASLISEPPFLSQLSNAEIAGIVDAPLQVPKWPCHTQPVERAIRLLTDAAVSVAGQEERDGFIRQRLYSRQHMPTFKCKRHYSIG